MEKQVSFDKIVSDLEWLQTNYVEPHLINNIPLEKSFFDELNIRYPAQIKKLENLTK